MTTFALLALVAVTVALVLQIQRRRRLEASWRALAERADRLAAGDDGSATASPAVTPPQPTTRTAADEASRAERSLDQVAARLAQEKAALEAERRKLEVLLASVPEGVLVTGSDRVPIFANRAFRALFDLDPGAATSELLALVRRPRVHDAVARALRGEEVPPVELQIPPREVVVDARRLEGLAGVLVMVRDVTETNRLARMRRDFVTNVSHEIKTPLAIIRGAAETLAEAGGDDPEATARFVPRIVEQIYRLEDLLKDLLTLARLESPEANERRQAVDLAALCRRAVEVLRTLADRERVELEGRIEPASVSGDAQALERMVLNLLVNGIQYNRAGGHVMLRLEQREGNVVLEVEDDGIGIPAGDLERIFERFYRVDKGRGRAEGGSGLGLAIVKHVAQAHGGTVEVTSETDRGSRFRVTLPAAAKIAAPPAEHAVPAVAADHGATL